jgi:DNA polymerase III delta subunit
VRFIVYGTDRTQGALGIPDPFHLIVEAKDPDEAKEKTRQERYAAGREHVHCWQVEPVTERTGA